jgi:hypothetical protein
MKSPAHVLPVFAFAVFVTAAMSALVRTESAAPANLVTQLPIQDDGLFNAIGSPHYRPLLGELQQRKINGGMILADAACSSNCRFYGGQY